MATQIKIESIQFKRGTYAKLIAWTEKPKAGEPIFEIDTNKLKIGDGVNYYADLPYVSGGGSGENQIIFGNYLEFPKVGQSDKLYIAKDTMLSYIWLGNKYEQLSANEIDAGGADTIY